MNFFTLAMQILIPKKIQYNTIRLKTLGLKNLNIFLLIF